uniref:SJCHGC09419 protein n=1 Tax=Schistosoma japonicum TaxID=6182 RepID=Q5DHQ3_SCHJA|nr:SJCHGC09419 protein [Schistosoma japonicum]
MSLQRKRFLEGSISNDNNRSGSSNDVNQFQRDLESEKHLLRNLVIILFGTLLSVILLSLLIYVICRRFRKHSKVLNGKSKQDDDDEYICFTKSDKAPYGRYTQLQTPETTLTSVNMQLQTVNRSNDLFNHDKMIYSAEDEIYDDELNEYKPTYGYSTRHQTSYIKSNVMQSTQQYIESAELKRRNENLCKLTSDQEKPESCLLIEKNRRSIRRVSSTPNLTKFVNNQSNNLDTNHLLDHNEEGDEDKDDKNGCALDDYKYFKVNEGNDEDIADLTLIDNMEEPNKNEGSESLENSTNPLALIPIILPNWAIERGVQERGYITLAVQVEGDLSNIKKYPFLSVRIFDVRCVLSKNVEPKAGKFYVKARLQLAGTNNSASLLSLDQISTKSLKVLSDKIDMFTTNRNSTTVTSGRTPVRRAYRSPVFRHKILLSLPSDVIDIINSRPTSFDESTESFSSTNLEKDTVIQDYELKIDLKERNARKVNDLHGTSTVQYLPYWKSSQLIGSVRIPITTKMWQYLLEDVNKLRRGTVVNASICQVSNTSNKLLWFVRCLQVSDENVGSRGEITFGMQYNQENGSLTISLFNCAAMNLPKRTKNLFVRASLCSNWKLIRTVQSRPTARLSVNSAEFILGEKLSFIIEDDVSRVCIILNVFARYGSKLQEATTLIGRCVTGPSDLACGDGLSHWTSVCSKRGMIRRTHILL